MRDTVFFNVWKRLKLVRLIGLSAITDDECTLKKKSDIGYFNRILKKHIEETNTIFVHVPKAAGTSIVNLLYKRHDWCHLALCDYEFEIGKEKFNSYKKLTFVRHPVDRFISAFNYLKYTSSIEYDKCWAHKYINSLDINEFVSVWLTEENVKNSSIDHFRTQMSFICDKRCFNGIFKVEEMNDKENEITKFIPDFSLGFRKNKSVTKENILTKKSIDRIFEVYKCDFDNFGYEI